MHGSEVGGIPVVALHAAVIYMHTLFARAFHFTQAGRENVYVRVVVWCGVVCSRTCILGMCVCVLLYICILIVCIFFVMCMHMHHCVIVSVTSSAYICICIIA